jgi:hypothetical protein
MRGWCRVISTDEMDILLRMQWVDAEFYGDPHYCQIVAEFITAETESQITIAQFEGPGNGRAMGEYWPSVTDEVVITQVRNFVELQQRSCPGQRIICHAD